MCPLISGEWLLGAWRRFPGCIWAPWERISDACQEEEEGVVEGCQSFAISDFIQLQRPREVDESHLE